MKKIILVFIISSLLSRVILPNGYRVVSKKGDISIRVNKDDESIDIKNSLPTNYFRIETKESSYIVIERDDKTIILMPKSALTYSSNIFNLESGYIYTTSRSSNNIIMNISGDSTNIYTAYGKSFAMYSENGELKVITYKQAIRLRPKLNLGINYVLEPYNKTKISPSLTVPQSLSEQEKNLLVNVAKTLDTEIAKDINKSIDRYSFKLLMNTKNETTVFRLVHKNPGRNVFVIVPHGNERVGTDVLSNRINMPIKSGSLTIVPVAVPEAYLKRTRTVDNQDINRLFTSRKKDTSDLEKLATAYMKMIKEYNIDLIITLHEGNGFKEFFEDAIIYDDKRLGSIASKIVENINARVEPYRFKFRPMHHPMPTTITYYAAARKIDAYAIEITDNMTHDRKFAIMDAILTEFLSIYGL